VKLFFQTKVNSFQEGSSHYDDLPTPSEDIEVNYNIILLSFKKWSLLNSQIMQKKILFGLNWAGCCPFRNDTFILSALSSQ